MRIGTEQPMPERLVLAVENPKEVKKRIIAHFRLVKAAGGVVYHENKVLLILRKKLWDLPKGKAEPYEKKAQTAKREVEEECNIEVHCGPKISTTYHIMAYGKRLTCKRTHWYAMHLINDAHMRPQREEGIQEVVFFSPKQAMEKLRHSFLSVQYVLNLWQCKHPH